MPGAASDAHVAPSLGLHLLLNISEVEGPPVGAGAGVEDAIEQPRGIAQRDDRAPAAVPDGAQSPGGPGREVITIEVFERRIKRTRRGELETGRASYFGRECIGRTKRIDVAASFLIDPAIKPV